MLLDDVDDDDSALLTLRHVLWDEVMRRQWDDKLMFRIMRKEPVIAGLLDVIAEYDLSEFGDKLSIFLDADMMDLRSAGATALKEHVELHLRQPEPVHTSSTSAVRADNIPVPMDVENDLPSAADRAHEHDPMDVDYTSEADGNDDADGDAESQPDDVADGTPPPTIPALSWWQMQYDRDWDGPVDEEPPAVPVTNVAAI